MSDGMDCHPISHPDTHASAVPRCTFPTRGPHRPRARAINHYLICITALYSPSSLGCCCLHRSAVAAAAGLSNICTDIPGWCFGSYWCCAAAACATGTRSDGANSRHNSCPRKERDERGASEGQRREASYKKGRVKKVSSSSSTRVTGVSRDPVHRRSGKRTKTQTHTCVILFIQSNGVEHKAGGRRKNQQAQERAGASTAACYRRTPRATTHQLQGIQFRPRQSDMRHALLAVEHVADRHHVRVVGPQRALLHRQGALQEGAAHLVVALWVCLGGSLVGWRV
jgi:hypothetical protein